MKRVFKTKTIKTKRNFKQNKTDEKMKLNTEHLSLLAKIAKVGGWAFDFRVE